MRLITGFPLVLILATAVVPLRADRPPPGKLTAAELAEYDDLPEGRRRFIDAALATALRFDLNEYHYGSEDPERGGFDCSGAVYYLLRMLDTQPPRTSSAQFEWVRESGGLTVVPEDATSLKAEIFDDLTPGDLVFWRYTYDEAEERDNGIGHVQIYLGTETEDGRHVMIGSTDGRTYRGTARRGFGVYDFLLPRPTSRAEFAGYGPPPVLVEK